MTCQPLNITAVWTSIFVVFTWGNIGPCKQVKHTWWTTIVGYMLVQISRMIQKLHVCCFACGCRSIISIHDQWWITGETGETQKWWKKVQTFVTLLGSSLGKKLFVSFNACCLFCQFCMNGLVVFLPFAMPILGCLSNWQGLESRFVRIAVALYIPFNQLIVFHTVFIITYSYHLVCELFKYEDDNSV